VKIFGSNLLQPAHSVSVSLSVFFFIGLVILAWYQDDAIKILRGIALGKKEQTKERKILYCSRISVIDVDRNVYGVNVGKLHC